MRKISKTMKPIRKHIINTVSSQNLVLIHSRQQKVAPLQRGICLSSRSQSADFKCPNSWSSNTLANWFEEPTHWKRPRCWERLRAGREGVDRGWDGWMASSTQWTWIWVDSRSWWWTGRPGMLGSQRVRHDWATEMNMSENISAGLIHWGVLTMVVSSLEVVRKLFLLKNL